MLDKNPGSVWLREYQPGDHICRQGEYGSTAFYIHAGKVDVTIDTGRPIERKKASRGWFGSARNQPHKPIPIDSSRALDGASRTVQLGAGDFFGEMTCLSYLPRSATVIARERVYCLEMLRNILLLIFANDEQKKWRSEKKKFLRANPGKRFEAARPEDMPVQKTYRQRALSNELRACPLLNDVPEEGLKQLVESADLVSMEPGEVIFAEGDPADDFFIVRRGFVKVSRIQDREELVMNYLSKGQFFGEIALLGDELGNATTRTATCTAIDHVDLIALGREDFADLVVRYPEVKRQLRDKARQRQERKHQQPPLRPGLDFRQYLDQGLMQGTNMLLFDLERCTRCDECVRACADSHGGVTRLRREGLRFDKYLVPTSCRSCRDPVCLTECPVGSIGRTPGGAIMVEDWCIGCRKCEENCPFGNIEMLLTHADGSTEIHKQQSPVREVRVKLDPPEGFSAAALPVGLKWSGRDRSLVFADVPGVAGEDEMRAVSADAGYQKAIDEILKRIESRIELPVLPADFKPPVNIEGVVKLKKPKKDDPGNAVLFAGVVDSSNRDAYAGASTDAGYQTAVDRAQQESRGLRAVLSKAIVCDLCESVEQSPNCVYACPHDAAFRVDSDVFFRVSAAEK